MLGQALLNLGLPHKEKKRAQEAKKCFSQAVQIFEECQAEVFLNQAKEVLGSLG
jgi:hypothetical protein